jgi:hypothetical protein
MSVCWLEGRRKSPIPWVDGFEATASSVKVSEAAQRMRNCILLVQEGELHFLLAHICGLRQHKKRRQSRQRTGRMGLMVGEGVD